MATNIFYRIPSQRGTRVATIVGPECTLNQFCDHIINNEGLNLNDFIIASGTKVFRTHSCSLHSISLRNNSHVDILIPLLGGKGGFGSLLRAIGAQIEKTTNRDACRDLSGRRLRDVKRDDELRKLIALQDKLQEERKRRKRDKFEALKRKTEEDSIATKSIQELLAMFDDQEYNRRRHDLNDILDAAVEKGIINLKKRKQVELEEAQKDKSLLKRSRVSAIDGKHYDDLATVNQSPSDTSDSEDSRTNRQRPRYDNSGQLKQVTSRPKRSDLWLGVEEE